MVAFVATSCLWSIWSHLEWIGLSSIKNCMHRVTELIPLNIFITLIEDAFLWYTSSALNHWYIWFFNNRNFRFDWFLRWVGKGLFLHRQRSVLWLQGSLVMVHLVVVNLRMGVDLCDSCTSLSIDRAPQYSLLWLMISHGFHWPLSHQLASMVVCDTSRCSRCMLSADRGLFGRIATMYSIAIKVARALISRRFDSWGDRTVCIHCGCKLGMRSTLTYHARSNWRSRGLHSLSCNDVVVVLVVIACRRSRSYLTRPHTMSFSCEVVLCHFICASVRCLARLSCFINHLGEEELILIRTVFSWCGDLLLNIDVRPCCGRYCKLLWATNPVKRSLCSWRVLNDRRLSEKRAFTLTMSKTTPSFRETLTGPDICSR